MPGGVAIDRWLRQIFATACSGGDDARPLSPAPDAASSLLVTSFNLGIGGGALVGSLLLAKTGTAVLPIAALVLAGTGALVAARTRPTRTTTEPPRHLSPRS